MAGPGPLTSSAVRHPARSQSTWWPVILATLCTGGDGDDRHGRLAVAGFDRTAEVPDHGRGFAPERAWQEVEHADAVRFHPVVAHRGPLVVFRAQVVLAGVALGRDARALPPRVRDADERAVSRVQSRVVDRRLQV